MLPGLRSFQRWPIAGVLAGNKKSSTRQFWKFILFSTCVDFSTWHDFQSSQVGAWLVGKCLPSHIRVLHMLPKLPHAIWKCLLFISFNAIRNSSGSHHVHLPDLAATVKLQEKTWTPWDPEIHENGNNQQRACRRHVAEILGHVFSRENKTCGTARGPNSLENARNRLISGNQRCQVISRFTPKHFEYFLCKIQ